MTYLLSLTIFITSLTLLVERASAQDVSNIKRPVKKQINKTKAKKKIKDPGQDAVVKIDGSAVYEVANFDSPVIEYMDQGKKIKISRKIYAGVGGLGAFYKVRIKKGVYGYIADTDVEPSNKRNQFNSSQSKSKDFDGSEDPSQLQDGMFKNSDEDDVVDSIYFSRFIGLSYFNFNYSEELRKKTEVEKVSFFGLRRTGPAATLGGMPVDINLVFTSTAPGFYDKIASQTSGWMLIGDVIAIMPFYESPRIILNYGLGLLLRYSSWEVKLKNQPTSPAVASEEAALGIAFAGSAGLKLTHNLIFRGDLKYYYEKEKYIGYGASLQFKY